VRDARGEPTGVLQAGAMHRARAAVGGAEQTVESLTAATRAFGRLACRAGCTTVTDLAFGGSNAAVAYAAYAAAAAEPGCLARVVLAHTATTLTSLEGTGAGVAHLASVRARDTELLRSGPVKVFVDGSIQGFTARLNWPGYHNGHSNGLFLTAPDALADLVLPYHRAGAQLRFHTNGDEAIDAALTAIEAILAEAPRFDHRHTLEHCQTATPAQFRRMAALGVCANLFPNHLYYWGDIHHAHTLGPERAARMNAAATALRYGVKLGFHADPPVTPLAPLFSAWAAVHRRSAGGRVLGEGERISVTSALYAITLGPAYLLKLDHEIGSIEAGKRADFAVLEDDPLGVPPEALKDVRVWGTVLGGRVLRAAG
jgi:predicted amidohydrolase YtcJ